MGKNSKNKGIPLGGLTISMMQWQAMHPFGNKVYDSDGYYQKLAQKIMVKLKKHLNTEVYSQDDLNHIALCLTAYFEDVVSELGLFRGFIQEYRDLFSREFPWYEIKDEYFEDEINLVDIRFVLWLSMFSCRDGQVPYPENPCIGLASEEVFELMDVEFENAPMNQTLVEDVYNPALLEDPEKLKGVLAWLGTTCYLLPIMSPLRNVYEKSFVALLGIFSVNDPYSRLAKCVDGCYLAFAHRCGPLAMYPKDWYALMRQTKGLVQGNEEILQIKATGVYPFAITKDNDETFTFRSCRGEEYEVEKKTLICPQGRTLDVGDIVVTMLYYYKGLWRNFGFTKSIFTHNLEKSLQDIDEAIKDFVTPTGAKIDLIGNIDWSIPGNTPYGPTYDAQKCDKLIADNNGDRLFYFKNSRDAYSWTQKNLIEGDASPKKLPSSTGNPTALFITEDYRVILMGRPQLIHDPSNPYFEPNSDKELLTAMTRADMIPNPLCAYMMDKNFSDRLTLVSSHGEEQGRKLMQDNIRFYETLVRQYPFYRTDCVH